MGQSRRFEAYDFSREAVFSQFPGELPFIRTNIKDRRHPKMIEYLHTPWNGAFIFGQPQSESFKNVLDDRLVCNSVQCVSLLVVTQYDV